jgi:DNA replication protein DnaC
LVIDDVGITPFDRTEANAFFQVVNRRYELRSATIVTTNRGLPSWAELFGGDTVVAAAILDRLLDKATVINIKGPSWRLREHGALTKPLADMTDPPERPEPNGRPPRRRG